MKNEIAPCVCCGGKWRVRVQLPTLPRARMTRYVTVWSLTVICGRCNTGDCGGVYRDGVMIGCGTGRLD